MDSTAIRAFKYLLEVNSLTFIPEYYEDTTIPISDMLLVDEDGLHFLITKVNPFFDRFNEIPKISICGMETDCVSVYISGSIRQNRDNNKLDEIFTKRPILSTLIPDESKEALKVFHLYRGIGEIFDLSSRPPTMKRFVFGGGPEITTYNTIDEDCTACGLCKDTCPVGAIIEGEIYSIEAGKCVNCRQCLDICPTKAIRPSSDS